MKLTSRAKLRPATASAQRADESTDANASIVRLGSIEDVVQGDAYFQYDSLIYYHRDY